MAPEAAAAPGRADLEAAGWWEAERRAGHVPGAGPVEVPAGPRGPGLLPPGTPEAPQVAGLLARAGGQAPRLGRLGPPVGTGQAGHPGVHGPLGHGPGPRPARPAAQCLRGHVPVRWLRRTLAPAVLRARPGAGA